MGFPLRLRIHYKSARAAGVSHMNEEERWNHIVSLDEELLKVGLTCHSGALLSSENQTWRLCMEQTWHQF